MLRGVVQLTITYVSEENIAYIFRVEVSHHITVLQATDLTSSSLPSAMPYIVTLLSTCFILKFWLPSLYSRRGMLSGSRGTMPSSGIPAKIHVRTATDKFSIN